MDNDWSTSSLLAMSVASMRKNLSRATFSRKKTALIASGTLYSSNQWRNIKPSQKNTSQKLNVVRKVIVRGAAISIFEPTVALTKINLSNKFSTLKAKLTSLFRR